MDLSKPWSGAYNTTNSQYGAFDGKAAASMHASSTTAFSKLSITAAPPKRPVVVCGPSGVGKGTLITRLMAECPDEFGFSVSHTTRGPRPGEADGVHYNFTTVEAMQAAIARGEFVEYAQVHTNIYGTSVAGVKKVQAAGKCCVLDIDVQGAELVKASDLNAVFVFIAPPSLQALEQRLRDRGTETEAKIQVRLANAAGELAYCDKPGFFDAVIVNDDVEAAYADFKALLQGGPPMARTLAAAAGRAAGQKGTPRTLLLVSDNLPEHELLTKATLATTTVVAVKYDSMSLADLGDAISKSAPAGTAFDAVGILDHGAPGRFCLLKSVGGGDIDLADLATDASVAAFLNGIGGLVKPGGRIDLLGCSVAAGPEGRALLAQVEALAGVPVTASTDKTGGAADADWEMETHGVQVGAQYFNVEALKKWKHAAIAPLLGLGLAAVPVGFGAVTAALGGL